MEKIANDIGWPITIIRTRYGGVYEGGEWLATTDHFRDIPEDAMGSDIECFDFFEQLRENGGKRPLDGGFYGVGDTIGAALICLLENIQK